MMKTLLPPLFIYLMVCLIALLIPASEGYRTFGWKLFVAQIYAIPLFIVAVVITVIVNKKRNRA